MPFGKSGLGLVPWKGQALLRLTGGLLSSSNRSKEKHYRALDVGERIKWGEVAPGQDLTTGGGRGFERLGRNRGGLGGDRATKKVDPNV